MSIVAIATRRRAPRADPPEEGSPEAPSGAPVTTGTRQRFPLAWLREPLVHFVLIGVAIFLGYRLANPGEAVQRHPNRIELTQDDLSQMVLGWQQQWQRPPTAEELNGLIEAKVRDEILYREALALGLDKDDTIVKRRMVQKMGFLAEDVSALQPPTRAQLQSLFAADPQRFAQPGMISFHHLYFSLDRSDGAARAAAEQALARLAGKPADSSAAADLADKFMFQDFYRDRSQQEIATLFGPPFADAVFRLAPGGWSGPVQSGFGWHVVWIDALTPQRVPTFEEAEPQVKDAWMSDELDAVDRRMYAEMQSRYEVVLPPSVTVEAARKAAPPAGPSEAALPRGMAPE